MAIPINNISLEHIRSEFGGPTPMSLSHYYAGGGLVSSPPPYSANQTGPIPTSGAISFGNFLGVRKPLPLVITPPTKTDMYGHSNGPFDFQYSGTYNATNLHFILTASGGLPQQDSTKSYIWSYVKKAGSIGNYTATIKQPQDDAWKGIEITVPQNTTNNSIIDFVVEGSDQSKLSTYIITVSDNLGAVATIEIGVGLWW